MKIGSIFCTDCQNIHEDTDKIFESIKTYFREDIFVTSEEAEVADLWLLICGCANPCIEHDHLIGKFGKLFVMSESDIPKTIHMIELLKEDNAHVDREG